MKSILLLLAVVGLVSAQIGLDENYSGYGDTSVIANFKADSVKYSKAFLLSAGENLRVTVFAADTGVAGFATDSVKFVWYIQTGRPNWTTGRRGNVVDWSTNLMTIDTFDMRTAANFVPDTMVLAADYTVTQPLKSIDTSSSCGLASQSRAFPFEWDVYYRVVVRGLATNNISGFLRVVVQNSQRKYLPSRNR
jgi:hypothetical protein